MMRVVRAYIVWLFVPVLLTGAALLLGPPDSGDFQQLAPRQGLVARDPKLRRTVKTMSGRAAASAPALQMGTPGLPIELLIKDSEWDDLLNKRSIRKNFKKKRHDVLIRVDNESLLLGTYKLHGTSSIKIAYRANYPDHLSYSISLFEKVGFAPGIKLKRFYLLNMISDYHYFEMRFSYDLLNEIGLFKPYTQYVAMTINGRPQGLYLLTERPKDAIRRTSDIIGIYRRKQMSKRKKYDRFVTVVQKAQLMEKWHLKRMYEIAREEQGSELISELEAVMDLDGYMTLLTFNSLVRNADNQDEIFYYVAKTPDHPEGRVEFMVWDYDDIMADEAAHVEFAMKDPLLFASEAELDHLIQKKPALYARLRAVMYRLLTEQLTGQRLRAAVYKARTEVDTLETGLPAAMDKQIREERSCLLDEFEARLLARRKELLQNLEAMSAAVPPAV